MRISTLQLAGTALAALALVAAAEVAQAAPLTWVKLTLINNWEKYSSTVRQPSAAVSDEGVVYLRGAIKQTSGSNTQIFVLPPEMRPSKDVYIPADLADEAIGRLNIYADGTVFVQAAGNITDAQAFTSLEGINFTLN